MSRCSLARIGKLTFMNIVLGKQYRLTETLNGYSGWIAILIILSRSHHICARLQCRIVAIHTDSVGCYQGRIELGNHLGMLR